MIVKEKLWVCVCVCVCVCVGGVGGGSLGIFGGGVPPGFPDPDPISEQTNAIISISV